MLSASPTCIRFIQSYEGLSLRAYLCPAGIPTIGYGQTGPDIRLGMRITETEANMLLLRELVRRAKFLNEALGDAPTTQGQFDAMMSLAFNIGNVAFVKSSVLKFHLAKNYNAAQHSFSLWNKAAVKGVKVILPGLVRRRAAEAALYAS